MRLGAIFAPIDSPGDSPVSTKEAGKSIETSTMSGYRSEARKIDKHIGGVRLCNLDIQAVNE